jgi:hypothetical protein
MSNALDTIYNISIGLEEGRGNIQIRLARETGNVQLTLFIDRFDESMVEKTELTFTNDTDLVSVIDTLRWARVANLKNKGYKVVM